MSAKRTTLRDRDRQYLSPVAVMGRQLTCANCGTLVDLVEPQVPDPRIDPDTFVGLCCMRPVADPTYKISGEEPDGCDDPGVIIQPSYSAEPSAPPRPLAIQIRQYVDDTFGSAA